MKAAVRVLFPAVFLIVIFGVFGYTAMAEEAGGSEEICPLDVGQVPRMSAEELKSRLDDPSLVIIDVRTEASWEQSTAKIKGARREVYERVEEWAPSYDKDKTIVLYCS